MGDRILNSEDYLRIRELVASSNQTRLHDVLGFIQRKSRVDDSEDGALVLEIFPSTPKATLLSKCLHYKLSKNKEDRCREGNEDCILAVDEIFQALLMIDPSYMTPWNALLEFVSALTNNSVSISSMLYCASLVDEFLIHAKFSFTQSRSISDENRIPQCIQVVMVQFVEKLMKISLLEQNFILENHSTQLCHDAHYEIKVPVSIKLGSELLRSVLTVCRDWCSDLFNDIVSATYMRRPSISTMKIWLQIVELSVPLMTTKQIERIGKIVLDLLGDSSIQIFPPEDIPLITAIVVEIACPLSTVPSITDKEASKEVYKLWRKISFAVLYQSAARHSPQCYLLAEKNLKKGIKKWREVYLKNWISEIINAPDPSIADSNDKKTPHWFAFHLIALCVEVLNVTENSSRMDLLDTIIRNNSSQSKDTVSCLTGIEYESILSFVLGGETNFLQKEKIDKMYYRKNGLFYVVDDGTKILDWLCRCGCLIMKSLHLNDCELAEKKEKPILSCARRIASMANHILTNCLDKNFLHASVFAIVAKTVAYFEVPEFRLILEGEIGRGLSRSSKLQNCHFSTLRLILGSVSKIDNNDIIIDRWAEIIDRSLPLPHETYLNLALTNLPLERSSVLKISKKLIAPLYSFWGGCNFEIRNGEQTIEPEMRQRIICSVKGLLELVRNDEWKENEIHAWAILSDSIVKDFPPLPFESRRWLYKTIETSVSGGFFCDKTIDRLLRVSVVRMSSFFIDFEIESKIFLNTHQSEEIEALHRLVTVLLRYKATLDERNKSRHVVLAQGREAFLRSILLYKKGKSLGNQNDNDILQQCYSIEVIGSDSFILCWLIFLKINFYLLRNALVETSKIKAHQLLESSSTEQMFSLLRLVSKVKEIEDQDLQVKSATILNHAKIFPSWPTETHDCASMKLNALETGKNLPYLDLLLEFLYLVPLPARESHDYEDPLSWKVITATGFLISQKRISSEITEYGISIETFDKTSDSFLSTSSCLVRSAFQLDCGLSALEELFASIVSYCHALDLTLEVTEEPECARMIGSLWKLYQALASEKACVKIIEYLESHISENDAVPVKRGSISLSSIYTQSDIDETVQKLRLSCLRPFLRCLSFNSNEEGVEATLPCTLIGGILGALIADLRAGLDGKSGGIPHQLYITYCMSIEECGSLLFQQRQSSFHRSAFLLFQEVTSTLTNILTTISLRDAALFRTTFILAVAVFPSMCRDLMRNSLNNSDSMFLIVGKKFWADSVFFDGVLGDCIEILTRWAALREPNLIPWLDIAGNIHSDVENDTTLSETTYHGASNANSFDSKEDCHDEIPHFVHVPSPSRNGRKADCRQKKIPRRIRFNTKEIWSWSLSCSLLGLEQKWLESERVIQVASSSESPSHHQVSLARWKDFFSARKIELQNSLLQINRFFHTSQGFRHRDQRGNHVILDMMAMNLPSAPRLRFCCLIECVSRVLIHSIQHSCSLLCGEKRDCPREISIFESFCCLSAWLSLDDEPEKDFSVGLFKWLAIASKKRPPGESPSRRNYDKVELFGRVSMVSQKVHHLYLALKELQKSLVKRSVGGEELFRSDLIEIFFESKESANEILRHTELRLHSLQQVMPREFQVKSFPDFPSSREAEINPQRLERKRVRNEKRERMPKPKRSKLPSKSRNKVVDMFMNLDKVSNSPRRKDAYADLEDFLVEG